MWRLLVKLWQSLIDLSFFRKIWLLKLREVPNAKAELWKICQPPLRAVAHAMMAFMLVTRYDKGFESYLNILNKQTVRVEP